MVVWNLEDIYSFEKTDELVHELKEKVSAFTKVRDELSDTISPGRFVEILQLEESIEVLTTKLAVYANMWFCENTSDSKRTSHMAKVEQILTEQSNSMLFFDLWFKQLPDKKANELTNENTQYAYLLKQSRKFKDFTLKENEERIINFKDITGCNTITKLYDIITSRYEYEWEGEKLPLEQMTKKFQDPNAKVRKEAYLKVQGRYKKEQPVLSELYKSIVMDWRNENMTIRGYKSPITVRNLGNDIPDEVINTLLNVIQKNVPIFQEYFKLKQKILKMDTFTRFDLYAPYHIEEKEYSYDYCKSFVLDTYKQFSQEMHDMAKTIFDREHVHSEIIPHKRSGAFCQPLLPGMSPYILLNHAGKLTDMFTMMHEFGHGIHESSSKDKSVFTFQSALPMAETASIFGEMLLSERLLKESELEEKTAVLVHQLDHQYASIIRQAYFVIFENKAHDLITRGATTEELNSAYRTFLEEQFGDMEIDHVFDSEWSYIPHIHHTPFYCYAYSFGNLLVLSLYKMYEEQGESFVPKYLEILKYGGDASPADILKETVDVDIADPAFWQGGFDIIKNEIEELRRLVNG